MLNTLSVGTGAFGRGAAIAALAGLTIVGSLAASTQEADARWRRGGVVAAGVIGGIAAGALIAGATRPAYGYYGGGQYGGGYYGGRPAYYSSPGYYAPAYYGPVCRTVRQRVWLDPWTVTHRRVRVCN